MIKETEEKERFQEITGCKSHIIGLFYDFNKELLEYARFFLQ